MRGKITKCGDFYIERAGKMVVQMCPFILDEYRGHTSCGDWCPLFGEPSKESEQGKVTLTAEELKLLATRIKDNASLSVFFQNKGIEIKEGETALKLCHKTLVFNEFTDERGKS